MQELVELVLAPNQKESSIGPFLYIILAMIFFSSFAKTAEFLSKYPVLSEIAMQKAETNTGMSRAFFQEVPK